MNWQSLIDLVQRAAQVVPMPPPGFLAGMAWGLMIGVVLTTITLRRRGVAAHLRRTVLAVLALVPPVLACLLWGVWVGIVTARSLAH